MSNPRDITFSALDPSQKNAFQAIDNEDTALHIVHGPPGTGKSQLVVSLLERLASEDKKVLFVSQNTEALKVIERMVQRTEKAIGYPRDNKYVSLLDFCLMLYNPTHRYLKYLREQYTRISGKSLPHIGRVDEPDAIQYILQYTKLDHNENYDINSSKIGFDELVGYYLRYVNQVMAPEPIRSFEHVDVRAIFHALDTYQHPDHFAEFNKPRRELVLLSTKNPDLSLPEVRSNLKSIRDSVAGSWIDGFATKHPIDIADYLVVIKEYVTATKLLDIYKIATEGKSLDELAKTLDDTIQETRSLTVQLEHLTASIVELETTLSGEVKGVAHTDHQLQLNSATLAIAEKDLEGVLADRKRIVELTKKIMARYPDIIHAGVQDIWVGLAQAMGTLYQQAAQQDTAKINALTAQHIDTLNADIEAYYAQKSVKRMLSGVPSSFKTLLGITSSKELETYTTVTQPLLNAFKPILALDGGTIQSILDIGKYPTKISLARLGIAAPSDMASASDAFLLVHELTLLLKKYDIARDEFTRTKSQLNDFIANLTMLHSLVSNAENKKLYISNTLEAFITTVNTSIQIATLRHERSECDARQKELQHVSYQQGSQFLVGVQDQNEYMAKIESVHEYLAHKEKSLAQLIRTIDLPDDNRPIEADLEKLEAAITHANATDNFSDFFFEMNAGQTVGDWLNSVTVLETYNNDAEIVDFIEHNKTINSIRAAMGGDNQKYLDDVLANDITFDVFTTRIVNVLVNESFGRARIADKKHVTTQAIIDAYEAYLKNQKADTYSENLRHLYRQTFEATKELSKQSTLQAGGKSTMDKFRHNTSLITEAFPIICATPKDVSKYIAASKGLFDYVIFDEASQLLPGQAIPSMYRAKKAVIIGDPHQMPPSLNASFTLAEQSEDEFDDLGESILDLVLKQPQRQHHLKVHYRSKYNKLFEPSREAIYSSDGIEPIFEAELASGAPIDIVDNLGDETDERGYDKNFYTICESLQTYMDQDGKADFCVLFTRGDVLSKFKDFIAEIGDRQFKKVADLYSNDKILLSTVTNCQGIEGAYTVIYMHHYDIPGAMWFFKESAGAYKRLNVSITRQRNGLQLLLADSRSHWVRACDEKINRESTGPNARKSAELMKALLTNAGEQANTTYLDRKLGRNNEWFDSPLTEQLYNKLVEHYADTLGRTLKIYSEVGWNLLIPTGEGIDANERNVGFRIDLGVYSIEQKKFILGIEMDGAMYHSGFDKEHSDYNRQKVLEEKGWKLYRIWSTNWLNDTDREFSKLVEQIDRGIVSRRK